MIVPSKKIHQGQNCARSTWTEDKVESCNLIEFDGDGVETETPRSWTQAARVAQISEEERHAFTNEMKGLGEDLGFANTWCIGSHSGNKVDQKALLDSGATECFIHPQPVKRLQLQIQRNY